MKLTVHDILRRPIISEKSTRLTRINQYVFEVAAEATRVDVKHAIETLFENVVVARVDIMNTTPKRTRSLRTRRTRIRKASYKKAIITLEKGNIPIFEGVKG
jgi:large subunit ribosomal protein L23